MRRAVFTLKGQAFIALDSKLDHRFTFTPALSLIVRCDSEAEFDRLYGALSDGGDVKMPAGSYGPNRPFGWVDDRFGVSWQLLFT